MVNENILIDLSNGTDDWKIISRTCCHCNYITYFKVTDLDYEQYVIKGEFVQDVFPNLGKQWRETIINGTHPECWETIFNTEED